MESQLVKPLDLSDFCALRQVLQPGDFAFGDDTPDEPPTDLIDEESWHGIVDLPDDVAIRTTSHQESRIALLHQLSSAWVEHFPTADIAPPPC